MARPLRFHEPGILYHVFSRGNERRPVFRDELDNGHFLKLLSQSCERFGLTVWAFVLMQNHYHLIVRVSETPLSRAMQWLGASYTTWHNRRHERAGHLFQGRFRAIIVTEQDYLARLICYVHRNPLRAGLAQRLTDYRWSSYQSLGYGANCPEWLARKEVLHLFGSEAAFRAAIQEYSDEQPSVWEDVRCGAFMGSAEAFERLWSGMIPATHKEVRASRGRNSTKSAADRLIEWAGLLNLTHGEFDRLRKQVRGQVRPMRDLLMYALWSDSHYSMETIGGLFGVGYTSVANARRRAEELLAKDGRLRQRFQRANDK